MVLDEETGNLLSLAAQQFSQDRIAVQMERRRILPAGIVVATNLQNRAASVTCRSRG
jgi:hypothetical protein